MDRSDVFLVSGELNTGLVKMLQMVPEPAYRGATMGRPRRQRLLLFSNEENIRRRFLPQPDDTAAANLLDKIQRPGLALPGPSSCVTSSFSHDNVPQIGVSDLKDKVSRAKAEDYPSL